MNGITIHLEIAEQENLRRHAEALGVDCEDIAYAAVQRLMQQLALHPQEIDREILHARTLRHSYQPLWSGAGRSRHPFEDAGNDYSVDGL